MSVFAINQSAFSMRVRVIRNESMSAGTTLDMWVDLMKNSRAKDKRGRCFRLASSVVSKRIRGRVASLSRVSINHYALRDEGQILWTERILDTRILDPSSL